MAQMQFSIGDRVIAAGRKATVKGWNGTYYEVQYDEPVLLQDAAVLYNCKELNKTAGLIFRAGFLPSSLILAD